MILPFFFFLLSAEHRQVPIPWKGSEVPGELARSIDEAVDRSLLWLRKQMSKDGVFRGEESYDMPMGAYYLGKTSLAMLALLSCGVPASDPLIEQTTEYILSHPSQSVYEAGLVLMALDMKAAPSWERKILDRMDGDDRRQYRFPRALSAPERERMERDTLHLLRSWGEGYWSYTYKTGVHGDISNTQFAVLGLRAASHCGIQVPEEVFLLLLRKLLENQERKGPAIRYPKIEFDEKNQRNYIIQMSAFARGWGYYPADYRGKDDVTGSRTSIGLACIAICVDELRRRGSVETKEKLRALDSFVQDSLRDGVAWLYRFYSAKQNPGIERLLKLERMPMHGPWFYYYLYGIERAGALLPTRFIGDHDWYIDGASELIRRQRKDGSWMETNSLVDTCFALLFLRRATTRSIFTTGGK